MQKQKESLVTTGELAAVTGASGRLGNVLVRELLARGQKVRVLEFGKDIPESLKGLDIEFLHGSVTDPTVMKELVKGASVLYHLAAKIDLGRDKDGSIKDINVGGTINAASAAESAGIRMIHCSSHHALERHPLDLPLDEQKPLALDEPCDYHRAKAHAEKHILERVEQGNLNAVIVSPGAMLGPGDYGPSMLGQALLDFYHGKIPILMEMYNDYVDTHDVVEGMLLAADKGRKGERYLLSGDVLSILELVELIEDITGRKMPRKILPLWVGWLMLPFSTVISWFTGKPPVFTAGILRASVSNKEISHAKASKELGFSPRSIRESLQEQFSWYRERGLL